MPMSKSDWAKFRSELLTKFSQAWRPATHINRMVLPPIPVETDKGTYLVEANGNVLYDTARALRAKPRQVEYSADTGEWTVQEHALGGALDFKEIKRAEQSKVAKLMALKQRRIGSLLNDLENVREKAVSDIIFGSSYYGSGHHLDLSSGSNKAWNEEGSDPVADILTGIRTVRGKIGQLPNAMVLGYDTYQALATHPQLIAQFKVQQGLLTPDQVKSLFTGVKYLIIGSGTYNAGTPEAPVVTDFWGDYCALIPIPSTDELMEGTQTHSIFLDKTVDYWTAEEAKLWGVEFMQSVTWGVKTVNNQAGYLISKTLDRE